ncbi:MAG: septum formation protein Maf [Candidatus Dormibacteraeota bacterium]|nr:septum formation protein Maf [Candidatus Dormibacteraeota bacterium]
MRIVLASSSPRRRELLTRAGIRFTVVEPPEDGGVPPGVCADLAVQLLARQKAVAVAATLPPGTFVLAADTIVVGPSGPLGKPQTPQRAREMLTELRGRRHTVLTGVCAMQAPERKEALGVSRSAVKMHPFSENDMDTYVASGEPLDRAGAYAIQGGGGDLVEAVAGRVDTVIGLDVPLALRLLAQAGYPEPLPRAPDVSLTPPRPRRPLTPMRSASRV